MSDSSTEHREGGKRFVSKNMKGKYFHSVDSKGRLIVPSKFRDSLGSEFVMTLGLEDCIYLYSQEEWDKFTERLNQLGNSKTENRRLKRYFQSNAVDCNIDSQGRTVIPADIRADVGIEKDVVIIGNGEKAEVWSAAAWQETKMDSKQTREEIRAMLEESDIDF